MKSTRLKMIRSICRFLPPIIAQQVRERLISNKDAQELEIDFRRKSFMGGFLKSNTRDFYAFKFFVHGYYDWRNIVLAQHILKIRKGDFIEVGANIGTETVSLAKMNKLNKVHAFEPLPENVAALISLKADNQFRNLLIYDVLVSDREGTAKFKLPEIKNSGTGYIIDKADGNMKEFEVVRLDKKLSKIASCSAIFIDVEGFEYNVINGARNIIRKHRPFLILEVNEKYLKQRANIDISFLQKELKQMKYKTFYIDKMELKEADIDDFIKSNKNWLCIPIEDLQFKKRLSRKIFLNSLNPVMSFKAL